MRDRAIAVDVERARATRARWGGREGGDESRSRFPEVFPHDGAAIKIVGGARMFAFGARCEG